MDKHKIVISEPRTTPGKYVEIAVSYSAGGHNYFSGGTIQRGYYLDFQRSEKTPDGFTRFQIGDGASCLLETASRFNRKQLERLALSAPHTDAYRELAARFIPKAPKQELVGAGVAESDEIPF